MNQETLDQLIGVAPPSTVDVHDVIRRTRRRRRVRRALAGGSTATAVVAVIAVGVTLVNGPQRPPEVVPPPVAASVPAAPSPSPTGFALDTSTRAGQEQALTWLRTALEDATEEHAPGTKWIYMPDVPGEPRTPDGRPILLYTVDDDTFRGRSGITRNGRKGGLYLTLRPGGCEVGQGCHPLYECERGVTDCRESRTPSGLKIVRLVDRPGEKWVFYEVDIELPGGRYALSLNAVNYFGGDGSPAVATTPVFTQAQLAAIATEIAEQVIG